MDKINYFPEQRVSEEVKHSIAFTESVTDILISRATGSSQNDKDEIEKLILAMNGEVDSKSYSYVIEPYGSENPKLTQFPAKLRNYNIITPIWQRFLGEIVKSRKPIKVGVNNPDSINKFKEELTALTTVLLKKKFQSLMGKSFGTPAPEGEEVDIASVVKDFTENWNDQRALFGQEAITYLEQTLDLEYKFWEAYLDWVALGQFYTYTGISNDDIVEEIVSPLEGYPIGTSDFIEDNDAFVRIYKDSIPGIMIRFGDKLSKEQYSKLEDLLLSTPNGEPVLVRDIDNPSRTMTIVDRLLNNTFADSERFTEIAHCVFKGQKEIKIVYYKDTLGSVISKEVSADYKLDKANGDIKVESVWRNRVYESYRLGPKAIGVYLPVSELLVQRDDLNNSSMVKLPYGGKNFLFTNVFSHSIIRALIPYQILFNVIHYYRELTIARNKGQLLVLPKGLLSDDDEISQEEAVYYIKSDGVVYVDETADNFANAINGLKTVNANDTQYISALSQILIEIKEEAWDEVSMNRQRFGQTYASDGKGVNEDAVFRASIGSLPINEVFTKAMEKEYMSLLDHSKYAWAEEDGTKAKGAYNNSDNKLAYFSVNGKDHIESNYGIFIANSYAEARKENMYEQLVMSTANAGNIELAAKAIEANNSTKFRKIVSDWAKLERSRADAQAKAEQETAKRNDAIRTEMIQREDARFSATLQKDYDLQSMKNTLALQLKDIELQLAEITSDGDSTESIADKANTIKDNIAKLQADTAISVAKIQADTAKYVANRKPIAKSSK